MATSVYDILGVIADFDDAISSQTSNRKEAILSHLKLVDRLNFRIPDFENGLEWLNVSQPLSFGEHLKGHIVILDFFTYCCINCMHILPDLEVVEHKFPPESGVVVVGVHSAKFLNEKVTSSILSAVLRYNISHPVVNDKDAILWQKLAVSCWPTLVFVGPSGQLIYSLAGEGHRSWILEFLQTAKEHYSLELCPNSHRIPVQLEKNKVQKSGLNFPGKVCFWSDRKWLVIADSGNHRILVTDTLGVVQIVVGSGTQGLTDGDFHIARFSSPQGIACVGSYIYVADTGNHCLRRVDLDTRTVKTVVGTGRQGTDKEGGKKNTEQEIASPWDLVLGTSPQDESALVLFIAQAGTHQIWVYFLSSGRWYNGSFYEAGTCVRFAGSGREENRNNKYPDKAGFAQPSGLALSPQDSSRRLYVADSESSSIRAVSLIDGAVSGLVGGEKDPTNLFAYGDVDGKGTQAKLQHPLGVAYLDDQLIIADSYNHKIKTVNLATLLCETLAGTGHQGSVIDRLDLSKCEFYEPGGVAVDESQRLVYVADTNNHAIKVIDLRTKSLFQLPIVFPVAEDLDSAPKQMPHKSVPESQMLPLPNKTVSSAGESVTIVVPLNVPAATHLNLEAPNSWKVSIYDKASSNSPPLFELKGKLQAVTLLPETGQAQTSLTFSVPPLTAAAQYHAYITVQAFWCRDNDKLCLPPTQSYFRQMFSVV